MIWIAFLTGIIGSMHCVGMCGPIALALPVPLGTNRYIGIFFYNTGRVLTYGFFGFLFGCFGSLFLMAGLQQFLSIIAGTLLLAIMIISLSAKVSFINFQLLNRIINPMKIGLTHYLKKYSLLSLFMIGVLNGFLPCGLVYMAIIGAVATGSPLKGSTYMVFFGLGTAPLMFLLSVFGNTISISWRSKVIGAMPFVMGVVGVLLILRGMNLDIPYLSPEVSSEKLSSSHCCTR